jgi:predicted DsbA family dithiol-disulfide isomerase
VRLAQLKREYGERLELRWKSFALVPEADLGRTFNAHAAEAWAKARANAQTEGMTFLERLPGTAMPTSSLPALEGAKCAAAQGDEAFERYHLALLEAYFTRALDISQAAMLIDLARQAELDVDRFTLDLGSGRMRHIIAAEYLEAQSHGIAGVPTVILADQQGTIRIVGEVPLAQYRRYVEWLLAT